MQKRHDINVKNLYTKKSPINGMGLYTKREFQTNSFIAYVKGPIVRVDFFTPKLSQQSLNWIGASKHTWIDTAKSPFKHINHSCNPNCYFVGTRSVYACKPIAPGSELTIDYSLNEADEGWSISPCNCGAKKCRKTITPITKISLKVFKDKRPLISKKFQNIFLKSHRLLT